MWYGLTVEQKEYALRGWNWGKGEFGKYELAFNVQNRPAFEIPYSEISNTNLAGKNELAVEFFLPASGEDASSKAGTRARGRKAGGGRDQLVEMRFYIPGTAKRDADEEVDGSVNGDNEQEEENAANLFYNTLMDKAEIGEVAGDTFATFLDVLHLTPRLVWSLLEFGVETDVGVIQEDDSISICTRAHSVYEGRRTIIRYNMNRSRNSCFFQSRMICIHSSPLV